MPERTDQPPDQPTPDSYSTPLAAQARVKLIELADRLAADNPNYWATVDDVQALAREITPGEDALYELVVFYLPEIGDGTRAQYAAQVRQVQVR